MLCVLYHNFKKDFIYLFLERGREGEGNTNVWLPLARPLLGNLTSNPGMCPRLGMGTCDPLICRPALNPLSHTSQGYFTTILKKE